MSNNDNLYFVYDGSICAFTASGGFTMEEGFEDISLNYNGIFERYDVTDAVQLLFDVKVFNEKLGLIKDSSNNEIIDTSFDFVNHGGFPNDSITIDANEFVTNMKENQVVSLGRYTTLYSEFSEYVRTYFGYYGGFASLFKRSSDFSINNDKLLDPSGFIQLINGYTNPLTGEYVSDLSGSIEISNINNLLRVATLRNIFNNRDPNGIRYLPSDGFISGDVIFIPRGTDITLQVNIAAEAYMPINNFGEQNVPQLTQNNNYISPDKMYSADYFASLQNIKRISRAPLVLRLVNLPDEVVTDYVPYTPHIFNSTYGSNNNPDPDPDPDPEPEPETVISYNWVNRAYTLDNCNWTSLAISHNGQYQTASMYQNRLYISTDFGITWNQIDQVLNQLWTSVAISGDGATQFATTYYSYLYKSTDYGVTWVKNSYVHQWTDIDMDASGQYITGVIIDGYIKVSHDSGSTWSSYAKNFGKKVWSAVKLSYTGKYQTALALSDGIYGSNDYGITWKKHLTLDANWKDVTMDATGQYQMAIIENGNVYESTNFGETWTVIETLGVNQWVSVAMAGDGNKRTVLTKYGKIMLSVDGVNYVETADEIYYKPWSSVAMSFSGHIQSASVWGGSIYTLYIDPNT